MSRSETAKLWRERLQRFASSQMTVAQFCLSEGVSQASYYYRKSKLRALPSDSKPKRATTDVPFMPLRLATESASEVASKPEEQASPPLACTTIELPGGIRIRVEAPTRRQPSQPREDRT